MLLSATIFRWVNNVRVDDDYTLRNIAPGEMVNAIVNRIRNETMYQPPKSAVWHRVVSVWAVGDNEGVRIRELIWSQPQGYQVEEDAPFFEAYKQLIYDNRIQSQRYGDMVLDVVYAPDEAKENVTCRVCGVVPVDPRQCSRCKSVQYCGGECQTKDWHHGGHKEACLDSIVSEVNKAIEEQLVITTRNAATCVTEFRTRHSLPQ